MAPRATGQALYFLNIADAKPATAEIRRAGAVVVSTQKEDGSWPMAPRAHPDATPTKFTVPITHLGSAWATIALARHAPK